MEKFRMVGCKADGSTIFEKNKSFHSLSECYFYVIRLVAEAMGNTKYCEIYDDKENLLETVGDAVSYFLSNDGKRGRVISCNDLDEAKEIAEDEKTSVYEYDRKTFKVGKCLWQKKNEKYPYEKYAKYKKRAIIKYSKEEWDNFSDTRKKIVYKDTRFDYYWLPIFYTFLGLLFVGGIVGGIVYGVWIDDILQGILLALGFPIFIVAGFFGAGKGL